MSDKLTLKLVCNDIDLHSKIVSIGLFDDVTLNANLSESDAWGNVDIILVSDRAVNVNEFLDYINTSAYKFKQIFYMLSGGSGGYSSNVRNMLKTKGVNIIPPKLTINQIVERLCKDTGAKISENKNIFVFFGADSKVGTSITVQTIAENIATHSRCSVLLLNLSGQPSVNYFDVSDILNLDTIKVKIINKVLQPRELIDTCYRKENLYILPTSKLISDMRHYHPEHIEYLVSLTSREFDVVLIDAGSNIHLGMCVGSLNSTNNKFLVTTQQDNARSYFEMVNDQVFSILDLSPKDFLLIVNKYVNAPGLYAPSQLADMYKTTLAGTLPYLEYGWQAERDKCTLLAYGNNEYEKQISNISKLITELLDIEYINISVKKKSLFKKLFA